MTTQSSALKDRATFGRRSAAEEYGE